MDRLKLRRAAALDFVHGYDPGRPWTGLVWIAEAPQ
jgi:hypothetical protein